MKRLWPLVVAVGLLGAAPAWGHEEITPPSVPVGAPAFLTLTVANEKQGKLTRLTLAAPPGTAMGATTRDPAGWASTRAGNAVTWAGGSVDPGRFESFGFELEEVEQPGTLAYRATLAYADGTSEDATVEVAATATAASTAPRGAGGRGSGQTGTALGLAALAPVASVVALVRSARVAGPPPPGDGVEQDW